MMMMSLAYSMMRSGSERGPKYVGFDCELWLHPKTCLLVPFFDFLSMNGNWVSLASLLPEVLFCRVAMDGLLGDILCKRKHLDVKIVGEIRITWRVVERTWQGGGNFSLLQIRELGLGSYALVWEILWVFGGVLLEGRGKWFSRKE